MSDIHHLTQAQNSKIHDSMDSQICEQQTNNVENSPEKGIKEEIVVNLDPSSHYSNEDENIYLTCTFCKQSFPTITELMQHRITHMTPVFQEISQSVPPSLFHSIFDSYGPQNGERTDTDKSISKDVQPAVPRNLAEVDKPYSCPICEKKFLNKSSMSRHKVAHTSTKSFPCDVCQKVFTRKHHLETHKKLHTGIKPYECEICLKIFSQMSYLNDHRRTHSGEKNYSCPICWKRFKRNSAYRRHEAIVHYGEKKFKCTFGDCGKAFTRKAQWQLHERIHNDIKPFQCTICLRRFARNCTLQEHLLTHSDVKPFYCEVCNKQYARKSQLVLHLRVHSPVKPFSCDVCQRQYTLLSSLKYHQKTHKTGENGECGERMGTKRRLKSKKAKVSGVGPKDNLFICDICGEQEIKKKKLISHLKKKHRDIW